MCHDPPLPNIPESTPALLSLCGPMACGALCRSHEQSSSTGGSLSPGLLHADLDRGPLCRQDFLCAGCPPSGEPEERPLLSGDSGDSTPQRLLLPDFKCSVLFLSLSFPFLLPSFLPSFIERERESPLQAPRPTQSPTQPAGLYFPTPEITT